MKKLIVFLVFISAALIMSAATVTFSQAEQVAKNHLLIEQQQQYQISSIAEVDNSADEPIAWVFHLKPAGFIIVTSDTDLVPVYAYSFRNPFSLEDEPYNTGLIMLKEDLRLRTAARELTDPEVIESNNSRWQAFLNDDLAGLMTRERSVFPPSSYNTPTGGWIVTQWDQGYPYNQFCPTDPDAGGRSVVGCVATSFAQVVNFHREIGELTFSDADDYVSDHYTSPVYLDDDWESYNFLNFPDLNVYMDEIRNTYANGLNFGNELKGAVSFACGILTEMQYSNSGSGTQTLYAGYAFSERLGYPSVQNIYSIGNNFYNILSDDMVNGRPAMMSILGGPEGHCIIADGWNSESDYYHLNMGWSGYDDGWYSLPSGMPSGYNVIAEAVCNIQGGAAPVDILGFVNAGGADVSGTQIMLDGAVDYICQTDASGMFELTFVFEGWYDVTATLTLPQGGYFHHTQQEYIESTNTFIQIDMDNYEFLTGLVTAPVDPAGTELSVFLENEIVSQGTVQADGTFQIPGLLPGSYVMVASQPPHYGRVRHINVSLEEQNFDFELFEYAQNSQISYAGEPEDIWSLIATTMSVAVKLTDEELAGMEEALISQVSFKAPISSAEGQLWAQVWQNETLIAETPVENFTSGDELDIMLDNFAMVAEGNDYFAGYKIQSSTADIAWHDAGPRQPGKGAWFRINSWTELPANNDVNFCIEATILHPMLDNAPEYIQSVPACLKQNYPNPFNPETTISFNLSSDESVSLAIFNIKGEKIKTIAAENLGAGEHYYTWMGKDDNDKPVASGIYFYKLQTDTVSQTRKMILLK